MPIAQSIGVLNSIEPPHIVAIHEKILMPVGTAMTIVAAVKYARVSTSRPTVYMWCAQTTNPTVPIATIARTDEHTSDLQSLMSIPYAVFCLKKNKITHITHIN